MIAATVLAAGASIRMGTPKALLEYQGRTFLGSILDVLADLGLQRLVVLGHDADKILSQHDLRGVTTVTNHQLSHGPIGSIRASIQAVEHIPVRGLLVWPVDFPHVKLNTAKQLIDRFHADDGPAIAAPTFEGKGGHPVIFGNQTFAELMVVPESEGARGVVRCDPTRVARVDVADSAVNDCINTPEAYRELLHRGE